MSMLRKCWTITTKDSRIYYLNGPVLIFGILFPAFLFFAFAIGRQIPPSSLVPGLIGLALFFTASAVTPAILPFETRTRTLERLLVAPLPLPVLVGADVLSAFLFGLFLSSVPLLISFVCLGAAVLHPLTLVMAVLLSAACFAVLGTLLSTPPTDNPSSIMTLANLVRLPLIFVSGVFVPHAQMPQWGQWLSPLSPLSYCADLIRVGFGGASYFGVTTDVLALAGISTAFAVAAHFFHRRTRSRLA